MKKLVLIELNEINFDLIKIYSKKKKFNFFNDDFLSNLRITSSESIYKKIEPWIQWVSIHTGKTADEHKIERLGDINKLDSKQIFERVEELGYSVGAICPMNTLNKLQNTKYFISDPWTINKKNENFFDMLLSNAIKTLVNNNSNKKFFIGSYFILLIALLKVVRLKTISKYIYLFFKSFSNKWNKSLFLDLFLNDYHINCIKKFNPNFTTVFFNAGAHIQHHYLVYSKIVEKKFTLPSSDIDSNYDPIEEMYRFYDDILIDYSRLKNYQLLIATGLTQTPYDRLKFYYRPIDHKIFLKSFLIKAEQIYPRMTRDFLIEFNSSLEADKAAIIFDKINKVNEKEIFEYDNNRGTSIFVSFKYDLKIDNDTFIYNSDRQKIYLKSLVSFIAIKNGMHDQKGFLSISKGLENYAPRDVGHVKNIYNLIENYFLNKHEF